MPNRPAGLPWIVALAIAGPGSSAWALDRARAIDVAREALGARCAATEACRFDATRVEGKWRVRVDFAGGEPRKTKALSKASPAIFLINDAGRIVGRIGSQVP